MPLIATPIGTNTIFFEGKDTARGPNRPFTVDTARSFVPSVVGAAPAPPVRQFVTGFIDNKLAVPIVQPDAEPQPE